MKVRELEKRIERLMAKQGGRGPGLVVLVGRTGWDAGPCEDVAAAMAREKGEMFFELIRRGPDGKERCAVCGGEHWKEGYRENAET